MDPQPVRIEELLAHAGWVRKLAARLVRDAGTADDVAQEVWAYALRSPPRTRSNLRAWLSAVVRNSARSLRRAEERRSQHEAAAPARGVEPAAAELVERAHLHRDLVEQVLALDEPHRSIVLAHWFEGQSLAEIARRQGLSARVVAARLDAAHERLRQRMDKSAGGREAWSLAFVKWTEPHLATAAAGSAGTAVTLGGLVLASKLVIAGVVVVVAAGLGWMLWPREQPSAPVAGVPVAKETHAESLGSSPDGVAQPNVGSAREALKPESSAGAASTAAPRERWIVRGHVHGAPGGRAAETTLTAQFVGQYNIQEHASANAANDGSFELDVTEIRKRWLRDAAPSELIVTADHPVCLLAEARAAYGSATIDPDPNADPHAVYECDISLTPGAVVTGRVVTPSDWKAPQDSGREPHRPCAGIFDLVADSAHPEGLSHTSCDEQGRWTLRANHGGPLLVIACAEGLRPASIQVEASVGTSTDAGSLALGPGATVSGWVERGGSRAGPGLRVAARLKLERYEGRRDIRSGYGADFLLYPIAGAFEHSVLGAETRADGSFEIHGLAATDYELRVDSVPGLRMYVGGRDPGELTVHAPQAGVVLAGVPPSITLRATVNGRPPTDPELDGVVIDLVPLSKESSKGEIDLTRSKAGYGVQLLPGVAYELRVRPGRYVPTVLPIGALEFGEQRTLVLDLKPQDQVSTLVLRFAAKPPEQLARVRIALLDPSASDDEGAVWQSVNRSDQGTFVLRDLSPGTYRALVRTYSIWDRVEMTYYLPCEFPLTLEPKATVEREVPLELGARLRMSAKDERGGYVRAAVELRDASGAKLATDFYCVTAGMRYGCGWYLCEQGPNDHPPLPAGHYEFTLKAEGFATEVVPVDLVAGELKTLDVVLHPK
ncbi:MAG: RNA polymerase sigma factor [Planctomycetes bacterium]|nr:RNA polymerase sigma factor [Planctomycetota bacterium]